MTRPRYVITLELDGDLRYYGPYNRYPLELERRLDAAAADYGIRELTPPRTLELELDLRA